MAVLAYCLVCDRLVVVEPKAVKMDGRTRVYYPIAHDYRGQLCPGSKRGI